MNEIPDRSKHQRHHEKRGADDQSLIRAVSGWLKDLLKARLKESDTRNVLEDIIGEYSHEDDSINEHERLLLRNVLHMHNMTARDIMVPRADIVAIEASYSLQQIVTIIARTGHSRLPVFRNTLDDILGMVHIKDVVKIFLDTEQKVLLESIIRPLLFIAPSVRVMDLLMDMRTRRIHLALVVDEYGGIDGLITIEDLVEEIVGSIEDEHDTGAKPQFLLCSDGTAEADARLPLETFEEHVGRVLSDNEREGTSTLGGLVFFLASRVPARGELIAHPSGMAFEVLDADPRRVKHLRVHNIPLQTADEVT